MCNETRERESTHSPESRGNVQEVFVIAVRTDNKGRVCTEFGTIDVKCE